MPFTASESLAFGFLSHHKVGIGLLEKYLSSLIEGASLLLCIAAAKEDRGIGIVEANRFSEDLTIVIIHSIEASFFLPHSSDNVK